MFPLVLLCACALPNVHQQASSDTRACGEAFAYRAAELRDKGALAESESFEWRALEEFQRVGASIDVARSYTALAQLSVGRGDYQAAKTQLTTAAGILDRENSADAGVALVRAAQTFLAMNLAPEAESALNHAEPLVDQKASILFLDTKGALLFRLSRFAEAERTWTLALARTDAGSEQAMKIRLHLAQIYSTVGEYRKAAQAFNEILSNYQPPTVYRGVIESELAWALMREGQSDRAEPLFRSAFVRLQTAGLTNWLPMAILSAHYATWHVLRHEWSDAVPLLRRAIRIGLDTHAPATASWLLECAEAYRKLGNRDEEVNCRKLARSFAAGLTIPIGKTVDVRELEAAGVSK